MTFNQRVAISHQPAELNSMGSIRYPATGRKALAVRWLSQGTKKPGIALTPG
ncbi:hypothetical protein N9L06_02260 [Mariniblastus sp.]|nr:hypothetical protein [Mariniblastus sp.]